MSTPEVLLWDHDGVLVDTERWYFEATRQVLAGLGHELGHDEYLDVMALGRSCWSWAMERGCSEADALRGRSERDALYQQFLRSEPIEIAGVEEVLAVLAPEYRMAIVTTALRTDFDLIHAERSIVEHFDAVIANGDYARSKPAPDPYLRALEVLGARPEDAVAIEDSSRGLRSALAAGIDCAIVHNDFTASQDFSGAWANIASLSDLPPLLERRGHPVQRSEDTC